MRRKIVAGNWKMNNDMAETEMFLVELKKQVIPEGISLMIAPAFTNLNHTYQSVKDHPVTVVAQNMHQSEKGAFTGEVSAAMLKSVGIQTVILGHSERRSIFKEDNALLAEKVNTALVNNMSVIFCVGEELSHRETDDHFKVINEQLEEGLFHLSEGNWKNIIIAYEPVWAIGTGETATPDQAQEMHAFIRKNISEKFNDEIAQNVSILYGGSVKPANAKEIFAKEDVDGGLIGGASLKAVDFVEIINAF